MMSMDGEYARMVKKIIWTSRTGCQESVETFIWMFQTRLRGGPILRNNRRNKTLC